MFPRDGAQPAETVKIILNIGGSKLVCSNQPQEAIDLDADAYEAIEQTESYRVRVGRGQRSRVVTVSAVSETQAREVALECAGEGWKVIVSDRCS